MVRYPTDPRRPWPRRAAFSLPRSGARARRRGGCRGNPKDISEMVAVHTTTPAKMPPADRAARDPDPWAMIDVVPLPTFICGADGVLLRYNKRAEELWGLAPEIGQGHRFGGAHRLYAADGSPIPPDERPVVRVL